MTRESTPQIGAETVSTAVRRVPRRINQGRVKKQNRNLLEPVDDTSDYIASYGRDATQNKRFYNIGAGRFRHPCWSNVDFTHENYESLTSTNVPDIVFDLSTLQPLPIENNVARLVYTSHTIEHIRDIAIRNLFSEVHRVLVKGGIFRITCPDVDMAYRAYISGDLSYFRTFTQGRIRYGVLQITGKRTFLRNQTIQRAMLIQFAHQVSVASDIDGERVEDFFDRAMASMQPEEAYDLFTLMCSDDVHAADPARHINWLNERKLRRMLIEAGFNAKNVYRSGYGQSAAVVLRNHRYFDGTRPNFSIYMEAVK